MRNPFLNYDAWKTAPPEDDEPETEWVSECCGAPRDPKFETDLCSECHDHCTFEERAVASDDDGPDGPYDTMEERDDDR